MSALTDVTKPYQLGIHLNIKVNVLDEIEYKHKRKIKEQKLEVIKHWLDEMDCKHHSWGVLADAVRKIGGHGELVKELKQRHEALQAIIMQASS